MMLPGNSLHEGVGGYKLRVATPNTCEQHQVGINLTS
jgi:hypothetical protein